MIERPAVPGEPGPPTEPLPREAPPASEVPPAELPAGSPPQGPVPEGAPTLPAPQPDGFEFTPPDARRAQAHADRLRAAPSDASIGGYPADLVTRAPAETALEPGTKPVLVLFYDDGARASNLQAAELLPLLVRLRERVDVVPIDVGAGSSWTPAQRKLVRTYYMSYVPTTVVLAGNRKPLLLQYQRVSAAVVEAALSAQGR